ncbi:ATP-binding protein [Streptomyces sp. PAL114]|uniref:ATP-binding protein n=1 Tax=Streptomyces sp. PAL114 TaxID=2970893 RepID=UPI0028FD1AC7|nr:ATP-binding protein [Streptomyces sp. PAL114]MDU0300831.1 ATP-binding protein [Streptomyces sp. PAL114]
MLTGILAPDRELPTAAAQFPSSPHGARLARRFAVRCLEGWGHPPASDASCAIALVVGELAANAVRHGRVPGRDFGLRLVLDETAGLVRAEVADAAAGKRPPRATPLAPPEGESGRGLLLVDVLAERWGWEPREPVGKTVWAECALSVPATPGQEPEGPA